MLVINPLQVSSHSMIFSKIFFIPIDYMCKEKGFMLRGCEQCLKEMFQKHYIHITNIIGMRFVIGM